MIKRVSKSIISITSKLLFIFLIIIVVGTFTLLIWTKQGLSIDNIELFNLKFSKVYIKWNKKLHIDIAEIKKLSSSDTPFSLPPLYRLLKLLGNTTETLSIKHFVDKDIDLKILYTKQHLDITSKLFSLHTEIQFTKNHILLPKLSLAFPTFKLQTQGLTRIFEKNNRLEMLAHTVVDKKSEGDFYIDINKDVLSVSAKTHKIKNLYFLNRFIKIPDNVRPWIFDKLIAKNYQLKKLTTHFPLANPKKFLENLYIQAKVEDLAYTFDDKLYPLKSEEAIIEYQKANLKITPLHARYNENNLTQTKIKLLNIIKNPKLELEFHTKEHISQTFLDIIAHYVTALPIKQFSGNNDIDFFLGLHLKNLKVQVNVDVHVQNAKFTINNHPVEIYDARVHLRNSKLTIDYAKFQSFKALKTSLSGELNLNNFLGNLKIYVSHFYTPLVKLLNDVTIHLKLEPKGITAHTSSSHWKIFDKVNFQAGKNSLFLDENNTLHIHKTHLQKAGYLDAYVEGALSLNNSNKNNDLTLQVNELKIAVDTNQTISLIHPLSIKVEKDNAYAFESNQSINLRLNNKPISIHRLHFNGKDNLIFKLEAFKFFDILQASLDINYSTSTQLGSLDLHDITADLNFTKPSVFVMDKQSLHFDINNTQKLHIDAKDYNISYSYVKKNHRLAFHDIQKFVPFSPLFKKLTIKKGRFNVFTRDLEHYNFFATINYFPIDGYMNTNVNDTIFLSANYSKDNGFKATLNNAIHLELNEAIELNVTKTNLDLRPFLKKSEKDDNTTKKPLPFVKISAEKGFLQLTDNDKVLYTKLFASLKDQTIKARLYHEKGEALLLIQDTKIELYGQKFNDEFIKNLINFEGLKGGVYNFFIKGDGESLTGGIEMENATAKGFALYNNILSFLNTIPAILTFNSPGFNAQGFKVNHGEIHFEKTKDIVQIKSIKLKGNASNVLGSGSIDLKNNTIDLDLRIFLFKDLGTIVSSIPIAGYLIFGDDGSLTTSINISGDLNDPEFSVGLGKDIIMAPINIIKRTLLSPVRLFNWLRGDNFKKDEIKF